MKSGYLSLLLLLSLAACRRDDGIQLPLEPGIQDLPKGFETMPFPEDNAFTTARWNLGKKLFFDTRLSRNNSVSCASCHRPEKAFADDKALSLGDGNALGSSNAPTLTNIGWHPYFTRAGSVPTLEMQVLVPLQEHNELNLEMPELVARIGTDSVYRRMAQYAYQRDLDPWVITRALACFERSIISGNSPYDRWVQHQDAGAMSFSAQRGMALFFSDKTRCSSCHSGVQFSNYQFENNGRYSVLPDSGRMRFTHLESDRDRRKVPTLRNLAFTAPYMHDGAISTLEGVVEHYNQGGVGHPNQNPDIRPLNLSASEKHDLVQFLFSLSDSQFITRSVWH